MATTKDQSILIDCSKKKLEQMLMKTKEELHLLDVEWLNLRSLALQNKNTPAGKSEPRESRPNFDDVSKINLQKFNMDLNAVNKIKMSQSDEESFDEEDD